MGISDLGVDFDFGVDLAEGAFVSSCSFLAFTLVGVERVGFDLPLAAK